MCLLRIVFLRVLLVVFPAADPGNNFDCYSCCFIIVALASFFIRSVMVLRVVFLVVLIDLASCSSSSCYYYNISVSFLVANKNHGNLRNQLTFLSFAQISLFSDYRYSRMC